MIKKVNVNKFKNQLGNISTLIFKNIGNIYQKFPAQVKVSLFYELL